MRGLRAQIEPQVEEAFRAVDPSRGPSRGGAPAVMWSARVTPAFPARWPAGTGTEIVYYAAAFGLEPNLRDGERVGAPWATVTVSAEGRVTLARKSNKLRDLGIQGVRPLAREETAMPGVSEVEPELIALVLRGLPARPPERIRAAYCAWLGGNAVLAGALAPEQRGFLAWLGCEATAPKAR